MDLAAFLSITQFLVTCIGQGLTMMDNVKVIDDPTLTFTLLDFWIYPVIIMELYDFFAFLRKMSRTKPEFFQ